jgi:hypothetical protein
LLMLFSDESKLNLINSDGVKCVHRRNNESLTNQLALLCLLVISCAMARTSSKLVVNEWKQDKSRNIIHLYSFVFV